MGSAAQVIEVGESLPPLTAHAVSVSLPTWGSNVGYEEGEAWVISKMKTGYPRFFIHKSIQKFASVIAERSGLPNDQAMLFPSHAAAARCRDFVLHTTPTLTPQSIRIIDFAVSAEDEARLGYGSISPKISAVLYPQEHFKTLKTFWQHSGYGTSSRRAEFCHKLYEDGVLRQSVEGDNMGRFCKGPRRYMKKMSIDESSTAGNLHTFKLPSQEGQDSTEFIEVRFGRNLELSFASNAKLAIKRRIAGSLTENVGLTEALKLEKDVARTRRVEGFSEEDVYLYPAGMNAIFNTHRLLMAGGGQRKSISFGFPYIDTLKTLEKFGPGCLFYGFGSAEDLDDLERRLKSGEKYLALFCEFPGNPLLKSPDLERIWALSKQYDFFVVVDETIGNFLNVNVLQFADVVVSSLTKVFSGDGNVMGGSAVLNPTGPNYGLLKKTWDGDYEDLFWCEDAIVLERNSRDFVSRIERINANAEAICELLLAHPRVKQVNYPKHSPSRPFYDRCRNPNGGYGGLLSATFLTKSDAIAFYDHLDTAKGPSLGTNFTLSSPYVILAHYGELEWAASFGVEADLVRFSVGLEDTSDLISVFRRALEAIPSSSGE